MFLNGAEGFPSTGTSDGSVFHPREYYPTWTFEEAAESLKNLLQACAGWQSVARPAVQCCGDLGEKPADQCCGNLAEDTTDQFRDLSTNI